VCERGFIIKNKIFIDKYRNLAKFRDEGLWFGVSVLLCVKKSRRTLLEHIQQQQQQQQQQKERTK
jgi:hypothetical protein